MKGLRGRIFLVGLLSALVGLLISRLVLRDVSEMLVARFAGGIVTTLMVKEEGAKCAADPRGWSFVVPGMSETFAYNPETLEPLNPAAPPLDRAVLERVKPGDWAELGVRLGAPLKVGVLIARLPAPGPCRLLQTTWRPFGSRPESFWLYLLLPGSVGAASVLLSFVLATRPLMRRIARLRRAAANVGADNGYTPGEMSATDDLGELGRVLDRTHERIRADAEALRREHGALERHLEDVAHDLRTPIASLQLALQHALTLNKDPALAEPLVRALGDTVYANALTENLRLASKFQGGESLEVAEIDLRALVEKVALRMKFFATQQKIDLEVALPDDPLVVACQVVASEQAIANIVENAVTFGEPGGHVAIVLQALPDARFVLTVVDDGPGVRVSEPPRLGERTFRSDAARQRAPRGSGLGLAIAVAVCERSGWELSFEGEAPQGLKVTLRGKVSTAS